MSFSRDAGGLQGMLTGLFARGRLVAVALWLATAWLVFQFGWRPTLLRSVWLDEAYSVYFVNAGWGELWRYVTTSEANMGLYYVLLACWRQFGESEAWVRLFSLLTFVGQQCLLWHIARRYLSPAQVLWLPLLVAAHFFCLRYGLEIRGYSLAAMFIAGAVLAWLRATEDARPVAWWCYVALVVAAAYSHFFALLIAPALVLFSTLRQGGQLWRDARLYFAHIAISALVSPLLLFMLSNDHGQLAWVPPVHVPAMLDMLAMYAGVGEGGSSSQRVSALLVTVVLLYFAVGEVRKRHACGSGLQLGLVLSLVPLLLLALLSLFKPALINRYLVVFAPFWLMALVAGCAQLPGQGWRHGVPIAFLFLLWGVSIDYSRREGEAWGAVSRILEAECHGDVPVVFYAPFVQVPVSFYMRQPAAAACHIDPLPYRLTPDTHFMSPRKYPRDISARLRGQREAWLLENRAAAMPSDVLAGYRQQLRQWVGTCVSEYRFEGIRLERYRAECAK